MTDSNKLTLSTPALSITAGVKKYIISWYKKDNKGEPKGPLSRTFKNTDFGGFVAWWGYLKENPENVSIEPKPILTEELDFSPEASYNNISEGGSKTL